jgi:pimeloyl-ACP methyl ester carboxylesterase
MNRKRSRAVARPARAARWGGWPVRRTSTRVGPYRIHAIELGRDGRALVLLHGLCGSSAWWRRAAPAFAPHYRVVIPDVIGFGRTRCPGRMPSIAGLADCLQDWAVRRGLGQFDLAGHSMGGEIAIHLAARHPEAVRRLVLVDSAGIPRRLSPRQMLRFAADLVPPRRWGDPLFLPIIAGDTVAAGPRVVLRSISQILRDDVRPLLPSVRVPTLVVWGEHDTVVPLADAHTLASTIDGARLEIIAGAAHNPMIDRPAEFAERVLRFLGA